MQRWHRDGWVKKARKDRYRSRAVYKLKEIDQREVLLRRGQTVLDLGAAPGGWSQYARQRIGPKGRLAAIDILPMQDLPGACFIQGDFCHSGVFERCQQWLSGTQADLVLCDIAPNMSGIRSVDQSRSMAVAECAARFSCQILRSGGAFLVKVFAGEGVREYTAGLCQVFGNAVVCRPRASRRGSRELYILARPYQEGRFP